MAVVYAEDAACKTPMLNDIFRLLAADSLPPVSALPKAALQPEEVDPNVFLKVPESAEGPLPSVCENK
jgi:hypothetical protein